MSNLQTYDNFKLDFQDMDQDTGGKWLIRSTKQCKDNQLQSLELHHDHVAQSSMLPWTWFLGDLKHHEPWKYE